MRSMFPGYYRPKPTEFAEKFKTCVFCFDTNVLLNLYRYTPESRESLIKVLKHEHIRDRIWLPHRVAFEYQKRRTDVLLAQLGLVGKVETILNSAISELGKLRRTTMFAVNVLIDPVKRGLEAVKAQLQSKKEAKPDLLEDDEIFDALTDLFAGKVGKPYSVEDESKIHKGGKERYEAKTPPGYEDRSNNPNDTDQYGDLVLWLQIIDYAKGQDLPIILVTDDAKEDWWREEGGETLGPRVELIEEFVKETGGKWFYMYSTERFLKHAKEHLLAPVTPEAIKEAEDIKKHDAQEEKTRATDVNIGEALDALKRGDPWAVAAAKAARFRTPDFGASLAAIDKLRMPDFAATLAAMDKLRMPDFAASIAAMDKLRMPDFAASIAAMDKLRMPDFAATLAAMDKLRMPDFAASIAAMDKLRMPDFAATLAAMDRFRIPSAATLEALSRQNRTSTNLDDSATEEAEEEKKEPESAPCPPSSTDSHEKESLATEPSATTNLPATGQKSD